jgi:hypothetical protein
MAEPEPDPAMVADAMMARELYGSDAEGFTAESAALIELAASYGYYWPRVILLFAGTLTIAIEASRLVVPAGTPEPAEIEHARQACAAVCAALGPMLRKDQPTARA